MKTPHGLIIEDNLDAQVLFADILEMCGVTFDTIANGQEALDYLEDNTPDILLVDMHLPKVNGVQIIRNIRENEAFADSIILVVSADHMMSTTVDPLVDAVILKPIDVFTVKTLVERLLQRQFNAV